MLPPFAVDHEEWRAGAVDFGVHFEAVDVVVFAGGEVVAVGDLRSSAGREPL